MTCVTSLTYNFCSQTVFSTDLYDGMTVPTLNTANVTVSRTNFIGDSRTLVNDATILSADNYAYNGVYHAIDRVLLPYSYV